MNRFQNMLDRGYEPGKTYGASPLCWCGQRPEYVVSINGQYVNLCAEHYRAHKQAKAEGR